MLRLPACSLLALLCALPTSAAAQDVPDSVKGLKIAVLDAVGQASFGGPALTKSLKKGLGEATGGLVPDKEVSGALKKLKLKGPPILVPENMVKVGKEVGAQFVMTVEITKNKWLYTAHAVMVNVETGEAQMDFRSGFYKPKEEAGDRGQRISKAAIEKLSKLLASGPPPAVAAATPPPSSPSTPSKPSKTERIDEPPPEEPPPPPPPPAASKPSKTERIDEPPPEDRRTAAAEPPPEREPDRAAPPPEVAPAPASESGGGADASATATVKPRKTRKDLDLVRASLTMGSGLLHSYGLSSANVSSSRLSYSLAPVALFVGEAEVIIPGIPVGIGARAGISPVKLEVNVDGNTTAEPSGIIFDLAAAVNVHLPLSGEGHMAYELVPSAGLRLYTFSVDEHPGDVVLSSSTLAPFVGASILMPFTEEIQAVAGVDFGLVVKVSEAPRTTGQEAGGGFRFGGGLGGRYWLTDYLGVALDMRFDLESVSFTGSPTRQPVVDEDLTDPSARTTDLRLSLGLALRV